MVWWGIIVQSLSHVRPFEASGTAAHQASLSFTVFWSLLKSIESMMSCNYLILQDMVEVSLMPLWTKKNLSWCNSPIGERREDPATEQGWGWVERALKQKELSGFTDVPGPTNSRYIASHVALVVNSPTANAGDVRDAGSIPGREDPLEEEMTAPSKILAWRIPWTEEHYGPWGCKELDMTEVTLHAYTR